jgi:hypothetical protein
VKIALDYDDTYTKDPIFWNEFLLSAKDHSHDVMIVTYRSTDMPIDHNPGIPVFYTGWKAKREFMEKHGIKIDVWIDDTPELILQSAT